MALIADDGSLSSRIVLIGEAGGAQEAAQGKPFVGPSGWLLKEWWAEVGLQRSDLYITNLIPWQPPGNNIAAVSPSDIAEWTDKLHDRLAALHDPWLLVPTGNTALRALTGKSGVTKHRGSIYSYTDRRGREIKTIPTIHPAAVFRSPGWTRRCRRDWGRIAGDACFRDLRLPHREHFTRPGLSDLDGFVHDAARDADRLAVDIETPGGTITCVGFSYQPTFSITIPTTLNYWGTPDALAAAWAAVKALCENDVPKITHNGHFDAFWLADHDIRLTEWLWDTLALHHSIDATEDHALAYCASVDTREPYWKSDSKDPEESAKIMEELHRKNGPTHPLDVFWQYCVDENTLVLMADFTWKPIKDIAVGDKILAPDEHGGNQKAGSQARRWRVAEVTFTHASERPCLTLDMESGRSLTLTHDHDVLVSSAKTKRWVRAENLRDDRFRSNLVVGAVPWDNEESTDRGWLGGFLDGEGAVIGTTLGKTRHCGGIQFVQLPGILLERAKMLLNRHGFRFTCEPPSAIRSTAQGYIKGSAAEAIRALGLFPSYRLRENFRRVVDAGRVCAIQLPTDPIKRITQAGTRRVVDIKTTTRTFIANGYVVHNCGKDACVTRELADVYIDRLKADGRLDFYHQHYRKLFNPVLGMMRTGIRMDEQQRRRQYAGLVSKSIQLQGDLEILCGAPLHTTAKNKKREAAGKLPDVSSTKVKAYMYDVLKLPVQRDRATRRPTANEVTVRQMMLKHGQKPLPVTSEASGLAALAGVPLTFDTVGGKILEHRRTRKLMEFLDEGLLDEDGRMRYTFKFNTITGRFACGKSPTMRRGARTGRNIQNTERTTRGVFVPEPGCLFLEADLSGAEDRVVKMLAAAITGNEALRARARALPHENDEHRRAASIIFNKQLSAISKDERRIAKPIRHGSNYGEGARTISEVLLKDGITFTPEECQQGLTALHAADPDILEWQKSIRHQVMTHRCLVNSWGRQLAFNERLDDDAYRQAYSFIPQSHVPAVLNQFGLVPLWHWLRQTGRRSALHAQIHDSLLLSCPPDELWDVMDFLYTHLQRPKTVGGQPLVIPVEMKIGADWSFANGKEFKVPPSHEELDATVEYIRARTLPQ